MKETAFLISIDVEEDMPGWQIAPEISVRNIEALPRLQALCDTYGVRPTYLITYPMAVEAQSRRVLEGLLATGRCEIGAHLHVWNTPPLPNGPERVARRANHLPREEMANKLATLTEAISASFGIVPRAFRAGRFGIDGDGLAALDRLGYWVDSSVTSGTSWLEEDGPDFRSAPWRPYFPSAQDPSRRGNLRLLEVPVSAGFTRRIPAWAKTLYLHLPRWTRLRGLLSRDYANLLEFYWLSPWGRSERDLIRVSDVLLAEGAPMLNIFLHSSELFPKTSAYATNEGEVDAYFDKLDALMAHATGQCGCVGQTLSEFRTSYAGKA